MGTVRVVVCLLVVGVAGLVTPAWSQTAGTVPVYTGSGTNTTDSVVTQSGDKVGIGLGTTAPGDSLHIVKATSDTSALNVAVRVTAKSSGTMADGFGVAIGFRAADVDGVENTLGSVGIIRDGADNSGKMVFRTANAGSGASNLVITATGNVGMGTTAPGYKVDVQGGQLNASGGLCIAGQCKTSWTEAAPWTLSSGNLGFTGNVGVGTTTPGAKLDVSGDSRLQGALTVGEGTGSGLVTYNSSNFYLKAAAGRALNMGSSGNQDQLVVATSGNVGIGTTGPTHSLHVVRAGNDVLRLQNSGGGDWRVSVDSNEFGLYDNLASAYAMYAKAGKIGVGTTAPGYKVDVQGGQLNASGGLCIAGQCKTSWTEANPWTGSSGNLGYTGNVGVGTTTPGAKFDVYGDSRLQGMITVGEGTGAGLVTYNSSSLYLKAEGGRALSLGSNGSFDDLVVAASGNVGIGTDVPGDALHVRKGTAATATTAVAMRVTAVSTGTMADGFGPLINFRAANANDVEHSIGSVGVVRDGADTSGKMVFRTANAGAGAANMVITSIGRVGIGTQAPSAPLHVVGNAVVTGDVTVSGFISAKYQDVAEWVEADEPIAAGSVVIADPDIDNQVQVSTTAYDTSVAGVISAQPGVLLGEAGAGKVAVAQSGRVLVKVDASYGAIKRGDLLVASPTPGHAMRSQAIDVGGLPMHRPGTLLGKALGGLADGQGEILVLLTLQ